MFNVGDIVQVHGDSAHEGGQGVIVKLPATKFSEIYGVDFGAEGRWLHNLNGALEKPTGRFFNEKLISLVPIEIIGDDEEDCI